MEAQGRIGEIAQQRLDRRESLPESASLFSASDEGSLHSLPGVISSHR